MFHKKMKEEFEDTKGVIRISKSKKDRQHNGQRKRTMGQAMIIFLFTVYINRCSYYRWTSRN